MKNERPLDAISHLLPPLKGHEYRLDIYTEDGWHSKRDEPFHHYCFAKSMAEALAKYFEDGPFYAGKHFRIDIIEDPDANAPPPKYLKDQLNAKRPDKQNAQKMKEILSSQTVGSTT